MQKIIACITLLCCCLFKTNSACGIFDAKQTCECIVTYTMGIGQAQKKLFDVLSADYCLGCNQQQFNNCKKYCQESVWKKLSGQNYQTTSGLDGICSLVAR